MDLAHAIVVAMEKADPPGKSVWSVEKVDARECAPLAPSCPKARLSSFYGTWVRIESAGTAHARYLHMAERIAKLFEGERDPAARAGELVGIAINESGLREDVEFGRVSTKAEEKHGLRGAGRGPSGEVCVMQILPSMARRYGTLESFLGDSDEALDRCFRAGRDQIEDSRRHCSLSRRTIKSKGIKLQPVTPLYGLVSRYGTGNTCTSSNDGKTEARVHTIEWVTVVIRAALKEP